MEKKGKIKLDEKKVIEKLHSGSMKHLSGGAGTSLDKCLAGCGCGEQLQCNNSCPTVI